MAVELVELAGLAVRGCCGRRLLDDEFGPRARSVEPARSPSRPVDTASGQLARRPHPSRTARFRPARSTTSSIVGLGVQPGHQLSRLLDLGLDCFELGRGQAARRTAGLPADDDFRALGRLDDQRSRRDERGDLGIAELLQEAEDIAIDRLPPDVVAIVEIAADADGVDPRIERRRVKRNRSPFAVPENTDLVFAAPGTRRRSAMSTRASTFCTSYPITCRPSSKAER